MLGLWPFLAIILMLVALYLVERRHAAAVTRIEENILALLMAAITLISFSQVVARYGFNASWSGALELTRILFAWMTLFGMSYALKQGLHLGVDAAIRALPHRAFRVAALFGALCTLLYAVILLSANWLTYFGANSTGGAVFYWHRFFTAGLGLDDLTYPVWAQHLFGLQTRVHRWIAYLMLPIGLALLAYRAGQAMIQIWKGERELVIAGHEAEDLVAENKDLLRD